MTAVADRHRTAAQTSSGAAPDPRGPELLLACLVDPGTLVGLAAPQSHQPQQGTRRLALGAPGLSRSSSPSPISG